MSQGKYHGKRLSATEVTRLYDAGERDFRGAILRGCDFFGVDLSKADFSRADIRSTNFTLAVLKEANFTQVECGVQKRWLLFKFILMTWLLTLFSAVSNAAKNSYLEYFIKSNYVSQNIEIFDLLVTATILFVFVIVTKKVFSLKSAIFTSVASLALGIYLIVAFGADRGFGLLSVLGFALIFITPVWSPYSIPNVLASLAIGVISIVIVILASILPIGIIQIFLLLRYTSSGYGLTNWSDEIGMASFILTPPILFVFICVWKEKSEFLWIVRLLKGFSVEFGTNFSGADLDYAKFSGASLKRAIFSRSGDIPVNLLHVRLKNARGLDYAWLGNTNLQDYRIRQLLITLDGIDQDFSNSDLRGVNLAGASTLRQK